MTERRDDKNGEKNGDRKDDKNDNKNEKKDEDLEALVGRFAQRRTYRPTDDLDEPDELPLGPAGTVPANASGTPGGEAPEAP